jgi:hypothetical protein
VSIEDHLLSREARPRTLMLPARDWTVEVGTQGGAFRFLRFTLPPFETPFVP